LAPTTTFDRTTVVITWTEPFNQGSDITGYEIHIQESDGVTFTEELTDCNRLTSATLTCTVPVITLTTTPYSIAWGESIYAKVAAINIYGISALSHAGNGAQIITYADAPISLVEDFS
jgi:hypothetical protein